MRSIPILTLSIVSVAAIAASRFVGFDKAQIAVAGKVAMGVAQYPCSAAGKQCAIDVLGTSKVETGGAFVDGALLKADASGRAILYDGTGAVLARALHASAGAGAFAEVLLLPSMAAIA